MCQFVLISSYLLWSSWFLMRSFRLPFVGKMGQLYKTGSSKVVPVFLFLFHISANGCVPGLNLLMCHYGTIDSYSWIKHNDWLIHSVIRQLTECCGSVLLGRITVLHTQMRPVVTDRVAWSVGRSVCLLSVCHDHEPCKNCWTDRDAIGMWTRVGPRKIVLDGGLGCILTQPGKHGWTIHMGSDVVFLPNYSDHLLLQLLYSSVTLLILRWGLCVCMLDAAVVSSTTDGLLRSGVYVILWEFIWSWSLLSSRGALELCLWTLCSCHQVLRIQGQMHELPGLWYTCKLIIVMLGDLMEVGGWNKKNMRSSGWFSLATIIALSFLTGRASSLKKNPLPKLPISFLWDALRSHCLM